MALASLFSFLFFFPKTIIESSAIVKHKQRTDVTAIQIWWDTKFGRATCGIRDLNFPAREMD
jgi:hypothetical protein